MITTTRLTTLCLGFLFVSSSLFLTNCKKDDKDPEPTPAPSNPAQSNTQKLTGKNFKMTSLTIDPAFLGVTDYYAQTPDCEKDNIIRFDTPDVFKEDAGSVKCDQNEVQTKTGTWVWNVDETVLTITMDGDSQSWTVVSNDGTTLKVKYVQTFNGTNYTLTATFVRQG